MDFATRYDFLKTALMRYDGYYHLSAVKASLLLTTNVILMAAVVDEESGLSDVMGGGGVAGGLLLLAAVLSMLSMLFAVVVLASYVAPERGSPQSIVFSTAVAQTSIEEYLGGVGSVDESALLEDLARVVHHRAVGLARKFRWINRSLWAFLAAIVLAVGAYLLGLTG